MCVYVFQSSSLANVKRVQLSTATVLTSVKPSSYPKREILAQFGSLVHVQVRCRNKRGFVHHGHTDMNVCSLS